MTKNLEDEQFPIFIAYRRDDGEEFAGVLYDAISSYEENGFKPYQVYRDLNSNSGSSDFKEILDAHLGHPNTTMILICTPAAATIDKNDGLYEEIDWWLKNRRDNPPYLVEIKGHDQKYVPELVKNSWPNAHADPFDLNDDHTVLANKIIEGLRPKSFESIAKATASNTLREKSLKRRTKWLFGFLCTSIVMLLFAIRILIFSDEIRYKSEVNEVSSLLSLAVAAELKGDFSRALYAMTEARLVNFNLASSDQNFEILRKQNDVFLKNSDLARFSKTNFDFIGELINGNIVLKVKKDTKFESRFVIWDTTAHEFLTKSFLDKEGMRNLAVNFSGSYGLYWNDVGSVELVDFVNERRIPIRQFDPKGFLGISVNGKVLVTSHDEAIDFFEAPSGNLICTLNVGINRTSFFLEDGRILLNEELGELDPYSISSVVDPMKVEKNDCEAGVISTVRDFDESAKKHFDAFVDRIYDENSLGTNIYETDEYISLQSAGIKKFKQISMDSKQEKIIQMFDCKNEFVSNNSSERVCTTNVPNFEFPTTNLKQYGDNHMVEFSIQNKGTDPEGFFSNESRTAYLSYHTRVGRHDGKGNVGDFVKGPNIWVSFVIGDDGKIVEPNWRYSSKFRVFMEKLVDLRPLSEDNKPGFVSDVKGVVTQETRKFFFQNIENGLRLLNKSNLDTHVKFDFLQEPSFVNLLESNSNHGASSTAYRDTVFDATTNSIWISFLQTASLRFNPTRLVYLIVPLSADLKVAYFDKATYRLASDFREDFDDGVSEMEPHEALVLSPDKRLAIVKRFGIIRVFSNLSGALLKSMKDKYGRIEFDQFSNTLVLYPRANKNDVQNGDIAENLPLYKWDLTRLQTYNTFDEEFCPKQN